MAVFVRSFLQDGQTGRTRSYLPSTEMNTGGFAPGWNADLSFMLTFVFRG